MSDEETEEEVEVTPAPSKLPLIGGLIGGLVLGVGIGIGASMAMGGDPEPAAEEAQVEELPPVPLSLGAFNINLRGGSRMLRVELEVELAGFEDGDVEGQTPRLRDTVLSVVSDYTHRDVEGMNGKNRLKEDLYSHFNAVMSGEGTVERVYFTQFVVQ